MQNSLEISGKEKNIRELAPLDIKICYKILIKKVKLHINTYTNEAQ